MLGKRSDQKGLSEADRLYLDYVGKDTFYGLLASLRSQLFSWQPPHPEHRSIGPTHAREHPAEHSR